MSNFTDLQKGIEAATKKLSELDDQHSKSNENMSCLINKVEDRVRQSQAAMTQNRTEYERIMREYEQAKRLLHSLELLTLKASSHSYSTGIFHDLDANEDYAEVDPDHIRQGLQRLLKKNGSSELEEAEAEESAT